MQFKIVRPDPEYPLVHVHIPLYVNPDSSSVHSILEERRITLLGRWQLHMVSGIAEDLMVPALLEDEHVTPKKTARKRK